MDSTVYQLIGSGFLRLATRKWKSLHSKHCRSEPICACCTIGNGAKAIDRLWWARLPRLCSCCCGCGCVKPDHSTFAAHYKKAKLNNRCPLGPLGPMMKVSRRGLAVAPLSSQGLEGAPP
eukprot:2673703-Amphidinium_carterae.1